MNFIRQLKDPCAVLNPAQLEAVSVTQGPVLVLAGAGTGKTRVLISRIAHLIREKKAHPSEILAVTFTNKAAHEMKSRLLSFLDHPLEGIWLGTFHSLGARFLRQHAEAVGLTPYFTILDTDDQERIVKQIMSAERLDDKKQRARLFVTIISQWKDRGLYPSHITEAYLQWDKAREALAIYQVYQERLRIINAVDFGDLLLGCLALFRENPKILEVYRERFKYILVDEYQDTNVAQYLWLKLLINSQQNICCVGDDDQSIYGWRGAEVENILRFEKDFPGAAVIRLEQNYRSTPSILGAASGLIAFNEGRLGKTLWTEKPQGDPVFIKNVWDSQEEARWVGQRIEACRREGIDLNQIAILVRAGYQTREFEEHFMTASLPYRMVGGLKFYERMEIMDTLAYLRIAAQPSDDLAFERVLGTPRRGIGQASLQKMHDSARQQRISLYEAAEQLVQSEEIKGKAKAALEALLQQIKGWNLLAASQSPSELTKIILDESGYIQMWRSEPSAEAAARLENLKELVVALGEFENLLTFLEHVSLVVESQKSSTEQAVTLMTMHAAKGLEFEVVFLAGWEEGVFPSQRSLAGASLEELEEERRLAYVGLTRARRTAHITFATHRRLHGQWQSNPPSRFIREIPTAYVSFLEGGPPSAYRATPKKDYDYDQRQPYEIAWGGEDFRKGERVCHVKFGEGTVQEVEGDRLTVSFFEHGLKKVLKSFISKARM